MAKAVITEYSFPSPVMANTEVSYTLRGHIESDENVAGWFLGMFYTSGPSDFIILDASQPSKLYVNHFGGTVYVGYQPCATMTYNRPIVFPVEGSYTIQACAGYVTKDNNFIVEDAYNVTIEVQPFNPASVSLTTVEIPTKAYPNQPLPFKIAGHVDSAGGNPFIGLYYKDGPTPTITVDNTTVSKGKAFLNGFATVKDACTSIELTKNVAFPQTGTYMVSAAAGYLDIVNEVFNTTAETPITVNVVSPPPPPTATLTGMVYEKYLWGLIKKPSTNAQVSLDTIKETSTTNGYYEITEIPLGSYTLKASKPHFKTAETKITLQEAKTYTQDLQLTLNPILDGTLTALPIIGVVGAVVLSKKWKPIS